MLCFSNDEVYKDTILKPSNNFISSGEKQLGQTGKLVRT